MSLRSLVLICLTGFAASQLLIPDDSLVKVFVDAAFHTFDVDPRDDIITKHEVEKALMFYDTDDDGCVTEAEFEHANNVPVPNVVANLFSHFDKGHTDCLNMTTLAENWVLIGHLDDTQITKPLPPPTTDKTMRPPRANSPKQTSRVMRTESLRHRCSDANTHEIIRFVRDIQFERQPTSIRLQSLQKKAPLPSIRQNACSKSGTSDSGFIDRATDSSDDDVIDNEIYSVQKRVDPRSDPYIKDMLTLTRSHTKTSTDYEFLSRLIPSDSKDLNNNSSQRLTRQNSFVRQTKKSLKVRGNPDSQRIGHHMIKLAPLSRDEGFERPSAPSPCRTPPASDNSFIEEEPVDFLDVS